MVTFLEIHMKVQKLWKCYLLQMLWQQFQQDHNMTSYVMAYKVISHVMLPHMYELSLSHSYTTCLK
jgi:hypothetical protein